MQEASLLASQPMCLMCFTSGIPGTFTGMGRAALACTCFLPWCPCGSCPHQVHVCSRAVAAFVAPPLKVHVCPGMRLRPLGCFVCLPGPVARVLASVPCPLQAHHMSDSALKPCSLSIVLRVEPLMEVRCRKLQLGAGERIGGGLLPLALLCPSLIPGPLVFVYHFRRALSGSPAPSVGLKASCVCPTASL